MSVPHCTLDESVQTQSSRQSEKTLFWKSEPRLLVHKIHYSLSGNRDSLLTAFNNSEA